MPASFIETRISPRRGPVLTFRGRLIAEATTQRPDKEQWQEARLWETEGGNWIAELAGVSADPNRPPVIDATVIRPMDDGMERRLHVMDALDWTPLARRMVREQLGWDLKVRVA